MPDMEKVYFVHNGKRYTKHQMVIKGLKQCFLHPNDDEYETQCAVCPYYDPELFVTECSKQLQEDVLVMLKEQEEKIKTLSVFAKSNGIDVDALFRKDR